MLPMGSIFLPLTVAHFEALFPVHLNILYRSKVVFDDMDANILRVYVDLLPFESIFCSLIFW